MPNLWKKGKKSGSLMVKFVCERVFTNVPTVRGKLVLLGISNLAPRGHLKIVGVRRLGQGSAAMPLRNGPLLKCSQIWGGRPRPTHRIPGVSPAVGAVVSSMEEDPPCGRVECQRTGVGAHASTWPDSTTI